jgi:hypothetical protein
MQDGTVPRTREEYIERAKVLALAIVDGKERPYDVGLELSTLGTHAALDSFWDIGQPLIWMWGSLTDLVDGPRGDEPDADENASALMIRAAKEWLVVSSHESARQAYFDRWVYDERGFKSMAAFIDVT